MPCSLFHNGLLWIKVLNLNLSLSLSLSLHPTSHWRERERWMCWLCPLTRALYTSWTLQTATAGTVTQAAQTPVTSVFVISGCVQYDYARLYQNTVTSCTREGQGWIKGKMCSPTESLMIGTNYHMKWLRQNQCGFFKRNWTHYGKIQDWNMITRKIIKWIMETSTFSTSTRG